MESHESILFNKQNIILKICNINVSQMFPKNNVLLIIWYANEHNVRCSLYQRELSRRDYRIKYIVYIFFNDINACVNNYCILLFIQLLRYFLIIYMIIKLFDCLYKIGWFVGMNPVTSTLYVLDFSTWK